MYNNKEKKLNAYIKTLLTKIIKTMPIILLTPIFRI